MTGKYKLDDSLNQGCYTYSYRMPIYSKDNNVIGEENYYICSAEWLKRENMNLHVCRTGKWNFFHNNGQLKYIINYQNGWRDDTVVEYFPSGIKKTEGKYNIGKRTGEWNEYYENGQEKSRINYFNDSVKIDDFWLPDGEVAMSRGTGYFVTVDTSRYGDSIITQYINHLRHGRNFTYRRTLKQYEKFRILEEVYYYKDKLTGIWKYYGTCADSDEESLSKIEPYKNDLQHGLSVGLFRYDTVSTGMYINGEKDGDFIRRRSNTLKVELIERWKMGLRHGVREYYDNEGKPELYQFFSNDSFIGEMKFENGIKISERIIEGEEKEFNRLRKQTTHNTLYRK